MILHVRRRDRPAWITCQHAISGISPAPDIP
jgi:hypothetical protein